MTVMDVKKSSEEEAKKRLNEIIDMEDWYDECQNCSLLQLLHKGACIQNNCVEVQEECRVWNRDVTNTYILIPVSKQ